MYRLTVHDYFSSAHQLNGYEGKCEELHGHNWKVEVNIQGKELDNIGLLIDFKVIKKILNDLLETLDHKFLNKIDDLKDINPSSENLARYIYNKFKEKLPGKVSIESVTIWESENARATYYE